MSNISWFKQYEQQLLSQGLEAEFNSVNDRLVTIEIIGIPKKLHGQGYGSKIMTELCKKADELGVVLQLRPSASSTHSRTKLIKFYSKFGFIENKGKNLKSDYQYMYRLPKQELVEQILKEFGMHTSPYNFKIVEEIFYNEKIKKLQYNFITKENITYSVYLDLTLYQGKPCYSFSFSAHTKNDSYEYFSHVLNTKEPFKILSTIVEIFKSMLSTYKDDLVLCPIECKGYPTPKENWIDETKRDKIYKALAKPLANQFGYTFKDNQSNGFELLPKQLTHSLTEAKDDGVGNFVLSWMSKSLLKKFYTKFKISKKIAAGGNGVAFLSSDGTVVKITSSKEEVKFSMEAKQKKYKHFVKIYKLYKFTSTIGTNSREFFIIIMNHVKVLSKTEQNKAEYFLDEESPDMDKIISRLKKKNDLQGLHLLTQLHELYKELYDSLDLHPENLGWDKNTLVAFDLQSDKNVGNLDSIETFKESFINKIINEATTKDEFKPKLKTLIKKYAALGCKLEITFGMWLSIKGWESIHVNKIFIDKNNKQQGLGTKVMSDLTALADQYDVIVTLTPTSEFGSSYQRLIRFYKRFGFVMNKSKNKNFSFMATMLRLPK